MVINTDGLEYGIKYDLTTHNGFVHKGWYLYSLECGYFSKTEGKQNDGFLYSESIAKVEEST